MRTVTCIEEYDKKRKKVYLEGEYTFLLYNSEIRNFKLSEGDCVSDKVYDELVALVNKRAIMRAMNILKDSQKTEKKLRDKLLQGGYTDEQTDIAVNYVKSYGYIDDKYFANYYIELHKDNRSKRDIEQHLMTLGVDKDVISRELEEVEIDELPMIKEFLRKKSVDIDSFSSLEPKEKNRIISSLIRKGFTYEKISKVLKGLDDF